MQKNKIPKYWKVAEIQLIQAAEFLNDPSLFSINEYSIDDYAENTRESDLLNSMLQLERIAKEHGCKTGFWRRLKKVATQLELTEKINNYEREFQNALSSTNT